MSAVDRFLQALAKNTPAQAKQAKVVMSGMLGMATPARGVQIKPGS